MFRVRDFLAICALLLAADGCGLTAPDFTAYQGEALSDSEVAIIDNWTDCPFCVDSVTRDGYLHFDSGRDGLAMAIELATGRYTVADL